MGVSRSTRRFEHDGARGPNMATVYSDRGYGVRAPVVFYNRSNEAAAQLKPGDFDWDGDLRRRRALVPQRRHLRGALGHDRRVDSSKAMQARRKHGAVVSFDLNYREKLVARRRRPSPRRVGAPAASSSTSTCWSATKRTCRRASASPGRRLPPGLEARSERVRRHDRSASWSATRRSRSSRRRCARCTRRTATAGARWRGSTVHASVAPTCELDVYDRVGGGDGFASGLVLRAAERRNARATPSGSAGRTARSSTTFPGDTTMATLDQVRAFAKGGSARIQR